jgi:hypothetical protein
MKTNEEQLSKCGISNSQFTLKIIHSNVYHILEHVRFWLTKSKMVRFRIKKLKK